jgi:uncharacterized protein with HEPN domain
VSASREEREQERLRYIRESIRRVERYTRGGRDDFLRDEMIQDATLRRLETLADACHHLPDELKARHPLVPWNRIYRFRNVAAHAYEGINLEVTWQIIEDELPSLKRAIAAEIEPRPKRTPALHRPSDAR